MGPGVGGSGGWGEDGVGVRWGVEGGVRWGVEGGVRMGWG